MVAEAFKQVNPADPKAAEMEYAQRNPTKRLGLPHEVVKVVAFLLSELTLSGHILVLSGAVPVTYTITQKRD